MTRKLMFFVVGIVLAVSVLGVFGIKKGSISDSGSPSVLGVPDNQDTMNVELGGSIYKIVWAGPFEGDAIKLIPNFSENRIASEVYKEKECEALVNGGFYTPEEAPTGLFISEGQTIREASRNSLFNGYLSINLFGTPRITKQVPRDPLLTGLQAGPVLIENSFLETLSLARDKQARRVVAMTTGENEVIFLIVYDPDSAFLGPYLEDMPEVLQMWEEKSDIEIADALNLDGGSASTFITKDITITEASPVGSFFCVRD